MSYYNEPFRYVEYKSAKIKIDTIFYTFDGEEIEVKILVDYTIEIPENYSEHYNDDDEIEVVDATVYVLAPLSKEVLDYNREIIDEEINIIFPRYCTDNLVITIV